MRNRKFWFVAYPESCKNIDDSILRVCPSAYAYILHDRDVDADVLHDRDVDADGVLKKPHYHIYLEFDNVRESSVISERFGVSENLIEKCNSKKGAIRYLIHADDLDKYQYSPSEIVSNNIDIDRFLTAVTESQKVDEIISIIWDLKSCGEKVSFGRLVSEINSRGLYDVFRRGQYLFISMWRFD